MSFLISRSFLNLFRCSSLTLSCVTGQEFRCLRYVSLISARRLPVSPSKCLVVSFQDRKHFAAKNEKQEKTQIVEAKESPYAGLTTGQKVKEAGKDASYVAVILVGFGVTGLLFYVIGRELFSSQSPSGIYGDALKMCVKNDQLIGMLGEPMKGYGETTRRGRRRHVSHEEFEMGGRIYMRMRFYVEGPHGKATVTTELQKNDQGKYDYRYVVAELSGYPRRSVLVLDNT